MCAADFNSAGRIRLPGGNAVADPDFGFSGATAGTGFSRAGQDITFVAGGSEKMRLKAGGSFGIGTTATTALLNVADDNATNVKVTRIGRDTTTVYQYSTQADAVLEWTCGSYHNAEVVITASQTNSGTYNNLYIRGIWTNNHTFHSFDELEHIGGLTGTTFTITNGQNGSTTNSGRLTLTMDYVSGSFATLNVRITDFLDHIHIQ